MQPGPPVVETDPAVGLEHHVARERASSLSPRDSRLQAVWWQPWCCWLRDGLVLAYFLSGGPLYDQRLAIVPGVSLNQGLATVCLLLVGISLLLPRRRRAKTWMTVAAASMLAVVLILRSAGTPDPDYARSKILGYVLFILPVLLYVQLNTRGPQDVLRYLAIWSLAATALVLLSIPHMWRLEEGQRLAVLAGGPNVFARIIGTGVFSSLLLFKTSGARKRLRLAHLAWLPLGCLALLLAGTKAVLAGLVLAMMAALWALGSRRLVKTVALVFVALCMLPLLTHPHVKHLPKDGGVVRLLRLPDFDDPEGSFGSRWRYVRGSLALIREQPWMGVGTAAWGDRVGREDGKDYPHNIFLEVLTELGFLGLVLVCWPLRRFPLRWMGFSARASVLHAGLLGLAVFWLVNVQLSGDLVDSRFLWYFLLLLELASSSPQADGASWTCKGSRPA